MDESGSILGGNYEKEKKFVRLVKKYQKSTHVMWFCDNDLWRVSIRSSEKPLYNRLLQF